MFVFMSEEFKLIQKIISDMFVEIKCLQIKFLCANSINLGDNCFINSKAMDSIKNKQTNKKYFKIKKKKIKKKNLCLKYKGESKVLKYFGTCLFVECTACD